MNKTIEREQNKPKVAWWDYCTKCGRSTCDGCAEPELWEETPKTELEAEPEYQHLLELCTELGLSLEG